MVDPPLGETQLLLQVLDLHGTAGHKLSPEMLYADSAAATASSNGAKKLVVLAAAGVETEQWQRAVFGFVTSSLVTESSE